jgi:hypothetical protein
MSITLALQSSFDIGATKAIAASATGNYLYGLIDNDGVYRSTDAGVSWTKTYDAVSAQLTSITCNSDGSIVYFCWVGGGLFKSTDYGASFTNLEFANLIASDGGPYIRTIACNSDGNTVIVSLQGGSTYVYISTNSMATWSSIQIVDSSSYLFSVVCNANANILYAIVGPDNSPNGTNSNIYTSTNGGLTWSILPGSFTANWAYIACDSTGTKLYGMVTGVGLYIFSPSTTATPRLITSPATSVFGPLATYSNGANLLTGMTTYIYNYALTYPVPVCFKEGSKILCAIDGAEVYAPIEHIRKGTLVKTLLSGYVPVHSIGTTKIYNDTSAFQGRGHLYKCSTEKYPELTEDLIITGHHAILVSHLTNEQRRLSKEIMGGIYVTDKRYRLIAMIDERAEPFQEDGVFSIWHLALENNDEFMNYGIYANGGLVVETTSKRMLRDYSGMKLL